MAPVTPTVALTQDQIDFYQREGYLTLPQITTKDEVQWLRGIYDKLFASRAGRDEGNQFDLGGSDEEGKEAKLPQILNPVKYAPELAKGLFRVNALAVATQLLGNECGDRGEHAIMKPARIGAETPWHQDEAYWGDEWEYQSMSIWIPLQPATLENGCMWFVPRSHKSEIVPHHSIGHDVRVHGLEMDLSRTIHHNRTMHYAGANKSDHPRRAYILGFGLPNKKRATPGNFYWNKMKQTARDERAKAAQTNQ